MIERSECGSGGCVTCPFSQGDEAFIAENSGCLPDTNEILKFPEHNNVNWGCHSEVDVVCGGFAKKYKETGKKVDKSLPVVDFDEYTYLGIDVAIALSKVRKGINPLEDDLKRYGESYKHDIHLFDYTKQ